MNAFDCKPHRDQLSEKRNEKTCQWFLEDPRLKTWRDWKNKSCNLLWVRACAGCGKSVLSSYLSQGLANYTSNGQTPLVAFFFCDDKDERRNTADAILRGLLHQILDQEPSLFPANLGDKLQWDLESLWALFKSVVGENDSPPIYCIVDGLDECEEDTRNVLLERLQQLFSRGDTVGGFKMIITSRLFMITTRWRFDWTEINLETPGLKRDITIFLEDGFGEFCERKGFLGNQKDELQEALSMAGDGTFLWASLMMESLWKAKGSRYNRIREEIRSFPPTVPKVYAQILERIDTAERNYATGILQWVLFAKRPLTLAELQVAAALQPSHTSANDTLDDIEHEFELYLNETFSFLFAVDSKGTVRLRHQSVKDFFASKEQIEKFDENGFLSALFSDIVVDKSNSRLATDCLHYLSIEIPNKGFTGQKSHLSHYEDYIYSYGRRPFFLYAAYYWYQHAGQRREENDPISTIFSRIAKSSFKINVVDKAYQASRYGFQSYEETTPLQICAHHGFPQAVRELLEEGADINASEGVYNSAIMEGILHQREGVVRVLLEWHVHINGPFSLGYPWEFPARIYSGLDMKHEYSSMLEAAVNISDGRIVRAILDHQQDPTIETELGRMSAIQELLIGAAQNTVSAEEIMKLLLDIAGSIKITEPVLVAAASNMWACIGLTKLLLDRYGNIDITEAVLVTAAGNPNHDGELIKTLLDRGGNIEITEAVLIAAARNWRYSDELIETLLDRGGNIEITEAVMVAVAGGGHYSNKLTKTLLDRGGNIKIIEAILATAVGNSDHDEELIKTLRDKVGKTEINYAIRNVVDRNKRRHGTVLNN